MSNLVTVRLSENEAAALVTLAGGGSLPGFTESPILAARGERAERKVREALAASKDRRLRRRLATEAGIDSLTTSELQRLVEAGGVRQLLRAAEG